jgi:hypothetical protein
MFIVSASAYSVPESPLLPLSVPLFFCSDQTLTHPLDPDHDLITSELFKALTAALTPTLNSHLMISNEKQSV